MCIHTQATTILLRYRNAKTSVSHLGRGESCQYKPRLAQMFRNGKTVNPNDAMLQLVQSILNISKKVG